MIAIPSRTTFRSMVAGLGLLMTLAGPAVGAETLEEAYVRQAKGLIQHCKKMGYKNVGVLKFMVRKDGKPFSDNVGTMNMLLATRLEVALVAGNDPRAPVGIIRNASAVAARIKGANHLKEAGRAKLFEPPYRLAWGKTRVKADAFLSGVVAVSKDRKTMSVQLFAFDSADNKLRPMGREFVVRNDAAKLAEMGESFTLRLRGAFDKDLPLEKVQQVKEDKAFQQAAQVKQESAPHPVTQKSSPVSLEIYYDGKRIPIEPRDGKAFVPEPQEGQTVEMVLKRDSEKVRYGVVLKVNGESTFKREKLPDVQCRRWVLSPGGKPFTIRGYQLDNEKMAKFRVLSPEESKKGEVNYGANVGQITMTVFRDAGKPPPQPDILAPDYKKQQVVALVKAGNMPEDKENHGALLAALQQQATRGLIGVGEVIGGTFRSVKFTPDPTPVETVTIIYYKVK